VTQINDLMILRLCLYDVECSASGGVVECNCTYR